MPGPAIALAGASLASGVMSAKAAGKAADVQAGAAKNSTALQKYIYDSTTANYAPYLAAGNDAMAAYLYEMGLGDRPMIGATAPEIEQYKIGGNKTGYRVGGQEFMTLGEAKKYASANKTGGRAYEGYSVSPMARYLMEEGTDSIEGGAAASGGLFSGATLEALENNRRTVIGADTSDYFGKLFGLTNMGMAAAGNQASAGSSYANNVSNLNMQAANAKAQGYMGQANAMTGMLGDMAGIYGYFNNPMAAYAAPTMATSPRPAANPYY